MGRRDYLLERERTLKGALGSERRAKVGWKGRSKRRRKRRRRWR